MSEILLGINVFKLWVGYWVTKVGFSVVNKEKPMSLIKFMGIYFLLDGCLPTFIWTNYFYLSDWLFGIFCLALYLDFKKRKKISSLKTAYQEIEPSLSPMTWDMWILCMICLFILTYQVFYLIV
jgi:hypothetical protein